MKRSTQVTLTIVGTLGLTLAPIVACGNPNSTEIRCLDRNNIQVNENNCRQQTGSSGGMYPYFWSYGGTVDSNNRVVGGTSGGTGAAPVMPLTGAGASTSGGGTNPGSGTSTGTGTTSGAGIQRGGFGSSSGSGAISSGSSGGSSIGHGSSGAGS